MQSFKPLFSLFLQQDQSRYHFAAHSHHLWPDCTAEAHQRAWLDSARYVDGKWSVILEEIIPQAQQYIADQLSLPTPETLCFAPNTHEFVVRLHSCLPKPAKILTTDAEFHSFARQHRRWEEAGEAQVEIVAAEPFATFSERFVEAATQGQHDMVYVSQVFYNSGLFVECVEVLAEILRERKTLFVIDGYHAFMALPLSLAKIADSAFFVAGGYKYAMAGEGVCFMHCPPRELLRPINTGWFAGFGSLASGAQDVGYGEAGMRFFGSTFDPSGLYRFNAVQKMLRENGITVARIHSHVQRLQEKFLADFDSEKLGELLPPSKGLPLSKGCRRGHFLTFRNKDASAILEKLANLGFVVDVRADRLRFGFGLYHDESDIAALIAALQEV